MDAFREEPTRIIVATHAGRRGHPLIFPAMLRGEVIRLQEGLNTLATRHADRVRTVETGDPGVVEDVDTWEQYRSLTSRQ
jgi:molybdenum cofactor cytidylyltransferase